MIFDQFYKTYINLRFNLSVELLLPFSPLLEVWDVLLLHSLCKLLLVEVDPLDLVDGPLSLLLFLSDVLRVLGVDWLTID